MFTFLLLTLSFFHSSVRGSLPALNTPLRTIEVETLARLIGSEKHIFGTHNAQYNQEHDVYHDRVLVHDTTRSQFFNMTFRARQHKDIFLFQLEDHGVNKVECVAHTMILHFDSGSSVARAKLALLFEKKKTKRVIIAGSFTWNCRDPKSKNMDPILRRLIGRPVTSSSGQSALKIETVPANYHDIFSDLDLRVRTNVLKQPHQPEDVSAHHRQLLFSSGSISNFIRGAIHSVSTWWSDIKKLWSFFKALVSTGLGSASKTYQGSSPHTWTFNYNTATGKALSSFDITKNLKCTNCWAKVDLTLDYRMTISSGHIAYLKVVSVGDAAMEADLLLTERWSHEWGVNTPKVPIPYLGFSVVGISFGVVVYGHFGIGLAIVINFMTFNFGASGVMTRGIEYIHPSTYNYITGDTSWNWHKDGPHIPDTSLDIEVYLRPSIFLELSHIGNVYAGIEPRLKFTLTKAPPSSPNGCYLNYAPVLTVSPFVGANLDPFGYTLWKKEGKVQILDLPIPQFSGCITKKSILAIQSEMSSLGLSFTSIARRRRRLQTVLNSSILSHETICNLSSVGHLSVVDRPLPFYNMTWGMKNSAWYGNLSKPCTTCGFLARNATNTSLIVQRSENASSMFTALHQISFPLRTASMNTDVHCSNTYHFKPFKSSSSSPSTNSSSSSSSSSSSLLDRYSVVLIDRACDVNDTYLNIPSSDYLLPSEMRSVELDDGFDSGVMFDPTFCHVYFMSQHPEFVPTQSASIEWIHSDPIATWFGKYHCGANRIRMRLNFASFKKQTQTGFVRIHFTDVASQATTLHGVHLAISVDGARKTMWLSPPTNGSYILPMNAQGIREMNRGGVVSPANTVVVTSVVYGSLHAVSSGTISFVANIPDPRCSALLAQGYSATTNSIRASQLSDTCVEIPVIPQMDRTSIVHQVDSKSFGFGMLAGAGLMALLCLAIFLCWKTYGSITRPTTTKTQTPQTYALMQDKGL